MLVVVSNHTRPLKDTHDSTQVQPLARQPQTEGILVYWIIPFRRMGAVIKTARALKYINRKVCDFELAAFLYLIEAQADFVRLHV